ncbi:hypothetical protein [Methylobacterium gregans]|uniref:Uncharacterized protein n=1 Tax=Methylobacterium gregans TaxID=374424 RepID=A0AA37MAD3_9HYPH|nr:hypothetical protein [Methylobacterium gregans]MDQ0521919.1 hypothetical protein [Methylobacterium gregans]GJD78046.1 hypothetical protein NBEOAGPD_1258 [Methylobacterium gregans]GLS52015.1 hypothetical protein GCM10007886_01970 [Methylobacterium gregans]
MAEAVVIRAHVADSKLRDLVRYLESSDRDVLIAADETRTPWPDGLGRKVSLTRETIESLGLPFESSYLWMLGDYALYGCRNAVPNFDFYWLIEQDVAIRYTEALEFFKIFDGAQEDLIAPELGRVDRSWWTWTETMEPFVGRTWRCFFPVTRLSGRAIDYLFHRRKSVFSHIAATRDKTGTVLRIPNDEAFVASELCEAGFLCRDINDFNERIYCTDTFRFRRPFPAGFLDVMAADRRIYHPVLGNDCFLSALIERFTFLSSKPDPQRLIAECDYGEFGPLRNIVADQFGAAAVDALRSRCPLLAEAGW